tara:strand:- start:50 stop:571 length:522 start_codon:yes stop_codon:yes gene_type:complete
MSGLKYRIASLMRRIAELEQAAESAESTFFDNPTKRSVRNLAESNAISNKPETVEKAIQSGEMKKDEKLIESEAVIAPPPPEEIVKKPGGKELGTLNQFIVKTEEQIKDVPNSYDETPKSKPPVTKEKDKAKVEKDLVEKVVERHLDRKEKVKAVKKVLQDKKNKGELNGGKA